MDFIKYIYENINVYFSLIIYDNETDTVYLEKLMNDLNIYDYPVKYIENIKDIKHIEKYEHVSARIFAIHKDHFNELCFVKNNNMLQYNVIFCMNTPSFNSITNSLELIKPICQENIIITKIF
jgi:esterase/lipase superfamily enzyme